MDFGLVRHVAWRLSSCHKVFGSQRGLNYLHKSVLKCTGCGEITSKHVLCKDTTYPTKASKLPAHLNKKCQECGCTATIYMLPDNGFPATSHLISTGQEIKCTCCSEQSTKEVCLSLDEREFHTRQEPEVHLVKKCKGCKKTGTITMRPGHGFPLSRRGIALGMSPTGSYPTACGELNGWMALQ
nr:hypothetical protein [Tanacetum cinerariifolium]